MNALQRTSLLTIGILFSFLLFIFLLLALYIDTITLPIAVLLTVTVNILLFFVSPAIQDFLYRWIYKAKFYSYEEYVQRYPQHGKFIKQIAEKYRFNIPKLAVIDDMNPTAFTYGSTRNRARIIVTKGIFHYLDPNEVDAVLAHELGHIRNNDFIIMTVAITLVQILYEIYAVLARSRRSRKKNPLALIGLIAYILYLIGSYIVLFLSRQREYYADYFAVQVTKSPHNLSQALVKIAYGIIQVKDSDSSKRLLESTRALGVVDVKNAGYMSAVSGVSSDPRKVAAVMMFDIVSPWAKLLELSSTHPLTGKRLLRLDTYALKMGQNELIPFHTVAKSFKYSKSKLYKIFLTDISMYLMPLLLFVVGGLLGLLTGFYGLPLIGFGLGGFILLAYKMPEKQSKKSTIYDEMANVYASPVRGRPIDVSGKLVGRGVPGFIFSEDMMMQDGTGLVYLNYTSAFGLIGNLFFGWKKVKKLIGQSAVAHGWFYRGISHSMTLRGIDTNGNSIHSHPKLWKAFSYMIIIILGVIVQYYATQL